MPNCIANAIYTELEEVEKWLLNYSTSQKCKQSHPGRVCDYGEKGECTETIAVKEVARPYNELYKDEED